jgi:hypothetical protein
MAVSLLIYYSAGLPYVVDLPHLTLMAANMSPTCLYATGLPLCRWPASMPPGPTSSSLSSFLSLSSYIIFIIVIVHPQSLHSYYCISFSLYYIAAKK